MSPGGSPPSSLSDNDHVRPIIAVGAAGIAELASSKLKLLVDWVADLEIRYPSWSQEQVLRNARETIENGAFGAKMRVLIYEDHPHNDGSDSGMSMTEQLHETETVYTPAYIEQPVPVPGYSHFRPATTVSSAPHTIASLTEYNEDFNFTEALERASASSFSSDDTPYTDQGLDAPLAFVRSFFKDNELIQGTARYILSPNPDDGFNNCTRLNVPSTRQLDGVISQKLLGYSAWNTGYRIGKTLGVFGFGIWHGFGLAWHGISWSLLLGFLGIRILG